MELNPFPKTHTSMMHTSGCFSLPSVASLETRITHSWIALVMCGTTGRRGGRAQENMKGMSKGMVYLGAAQEKVTK